MNQRAWLGVLTTFVAVSCAPTAAERMQADDSARNLAETRARNTQRAVAGDLLRTQLRMNDEQVARMRGNFDSETCILAVDPEAPSGCARDDIKTCIAFVFQRTGENWSMVESRNVGALVLPHS